MKKYIYLVKRTDGFSYDEYSDFVVVAETEEAAINSHPDGDGKVVNWTIKRPNHSSWPMEKRDLVVVKLGEALDNTDFGVVCASFHAG